MKILLSYPSQHDKSEGVNYSRVLRRLGHEIIEINSSASSNGLWEPRKVVMGFPADTCIHDLISRYGRCDLFLYIEPLGLIPRNLNESPIPTACVISDCHRQLEPRLALSKFFDHVFLYQRNYLERFSSHPPGNVHWLPYACDVENFKTQETDRDLDVAFIGNLFEPGNERRKILDILNEKYRLNERRYYLQEEIPKIYSRSKIVLNLPIGDDLNFRFFEALSCGALLITKRLNSGQEELFKEEIHYVAFDDKHELLEKIEFYLENEEARMKIAEAGYETVKKSHTLILRVEELLKKVFDKPEKLAPIRNMNSQEVIGQYAQYYEKNGKIDTLLNFASGFKEDGWMRFKILMKAGRAFLRRAINGW